MRDLLWKLDVFVFCGVVGSDEVPASAGMVLVSSWDGYDPMFFFLSRQGSMLGTAPEPFVWLDKEFQCNEGIGSHLELRGRYAGAVLRTSWDFRGSW